MFHSCFTKSQAATSRWILPHVYWAWWKSDDDEYKKKNILNINAVEIVEAGCFEVHALHTFFYHSTIFQYFRETP